MRMDVACRLILGDSAILAGELGPLEVILDSTPGRIRRTSPRLSSCTWNSWFQCRAVTPDVSRHIFCAFSHLLQKLSEAFSTDSRSQSLHCLHIRHSSHCLCRLPVFLALIFASEAMCLDHFLATLGLSTTSSG